MNVKGFLIEGEGEEEWLLSMQPTRRAMFERLVMREQADTDWVDAQPLPQQSRTEATMAVLSYLHRLWQMSGPLKVLDH